VPTRDNQSTPLGQAIRERREELGLTQEVVAASAGLATKRIWEIERRQTNPTHSTLLAISAALHVPVELLTLRARVIEDDRERELAPRRR
jgi:transcriptional regulator with XRE-family HTH domain